MKQPIRSFSIGLFTSGIIFLIIFMIFGGVDNKKTESSAEEMITSLEDNGYHVLTDSDYISLSVQKDQETENGDEDSQDNEENAESEETSNNDDEDIDEENNEDNDSQDEDTDSNENTDDENQEAVTYSLTIDEGMASSAISAALEENDIIDDAEKFNRFLEEEGYELKVQIGTYDVSNDMDFEEIANTITN